MKYGNLAEWVAGLVAALALLGTVSGLRDDRQRRNRDTALRTTVWAEWTREDEPNPVARPFSAYVQNPGERPIFIQDVWATPQGSTTPVKLRWIATVVPPTDRRDYILCPETFPYDARQKPPYVKARFIDGNAVWWETDSKGSLRRLGVSDPDGELRPQRTSRLRLR